MTDRERSRRNVKAWRERNPERSREINENWRKRNLAKVAAYKRAWRAKKKALKQEELTNGNLRTDQDRE